VLLLLLQLDVSAGPPLPVTSNDIMLFQGQLLLCLHSTFLCAKLLLKGCKRVTVGVGTNLTPRISPLALKSKT
jgi:hypothetical protein